LSACADNRFLIALLVRGDLDSAEEARLRAHLAGCPTCASELAAEERLSRRLAELPRFAAPGDLKAQVQDTMRVRRGRGRVLRIPPRRLLVAGGAVAALLIIGAVLTLRRQSAPDPLALAARQAAAEHQMIELQRDLLPNETAGAGARLRELAERYSLPATTAFPGDPELQLISVRPGSALGRVSAVLIYLDRQGRLVTLEILPGKDVQIPPDRTRRVQQFRPVLARVEQRGIVLWKQGGALYLLTAPVEDEELERLYVKVRTRTS
jgi:putative zinc finger protein